MVLSLGLDSSSLAEPTGVLRLALALGVGFLLVLIVWRTLVLRIVSSVAADVAKEVLRSVLSDEDLMRLASARWQEMMVALNENPEFQRTTPDAIMSVMIQDRMQGMFTKLLREKDFVKSSVNAMHDVIHDDTLKAALKGQLKETFEDDTLHKAIIKGSLEAMKPGWVRALEGGGDDSAQRTSNTPPTQRSPSHERSSGRSCG